MPALTETVKPRAHTGSQTDAQSRPGWLGPPLRTLHQAAFDAACGGLMRMVEGDFAPTLVVGIRTGGLTVANSMMRAGARRVPLMPVTCRRAATTAKSRLPWLRALLGLLPGKLVDLLRRLEHRLFITRRAHRQGGQSIDQAEAAAVAALLAAGPAEARILVVDDAVDSGVTLLTVLRTLREICPAGTEIRSAVITQTLENPQISPDYVLYRGVLCRFPWSFDAARG